MESIPVTLNIAPEHYQQLTQEDGHHVGNGVSLHLTPTRYGTYDLTVHITTPTPNA